MTGPVDRSYKERRRNFKAYTGLSILTGAASVAGMATAFGLVSGASPDPGNPVGLALTLMFTLQSGITGHYAAVNYIPRRDGKLRELRY